MLNFEELKHGSMIDKSIYGTVTGLLNDIFGRTSGEFAFDLTMHTEDNEKKILDNWLFFKRMFKLESKIKSQQKVITQTFKSIVSFLNETYSFEQPITIKKHVKSIMDYSTKFHTTINQTIITF